MPTIRINGNDYNVTNGVKIPKANNALEEFIQPSGTKQITANGTHDVSGYAVAEVDVSGGGPTLQTKTATPTTSQQTIEPDNGYDGLSSVTLDAIPSGYLIPTGNKEITENGTNIDVAAFATVSVNVSGGGGSFEPVTGYTEINAQNNVAISMQIGDFDTNDFLVFIQLVESGTYATSGDASSALTLDTDVEGINVGTWSLYSLFYVTTWPKDTSVTYQQAVEWPNAIVGKITTANKTTAPLTLGSQFQSYSDGVLTISNVGCSTGYATKHFKYKWTVYPM